jgi:GNAT superfamily N-acetyltransferase
MVCMIEFKETKDISGEQLVKLFDAVGWIRPKHEKPTIEDNWDHIANHTLYIDHDDSNDIIERAFQNSTFVASAWDGDKLVGAVRVLSDGIQRSIVYDLAVLPEHQSQGIGKRLVERCLQAFPDTQFTLGTSSMNFPFYERFGFIGSRNYMEKASDTF